MNKPSISPLVTFRQKRCEFVCSFVTTYRDEVAEALELLFQDEDAAATQPAGTTAELLERLLRRMKVALGNLLEAERKHLNESSDDALPRKRRDEAASTKVAKDRAMKRFDHSYRQIVRMLVPAFRLAGHDELAEKIPTSLRRPRRRASAAVPSVPAS